MARAASRQGTYFCADLELDPRERVIRVAGSVILPTFAEFEILFRLIREPRRVFSRAELGESLVKHADRGPRAIDVHITRLRHKIALARDFRIEAVRHVGYRCYDPSDDGTRAMADRRI